MKHQKLKVILQFGLSFCILIFAFCISGRAEAAILYLESSQNEYRQGQTFVVEARIDAEGECINTVKADLSFPKDVLEAIDFGRGGSILNLWLKPPEINQTQGLISFIAGIPGGYCGKLSGDPGSSNLLGKIVFKAKEINGGEPSVEVEFLDSSQVLLNDGLGTSAKLTAKRIALKILLKGTEVPEDEWDKELKKDTLPPEPFNIEVHQDASVFEGKYFITFSTADKQTGIDYLEIKEGKKEWKKGESPYLLEDQSLRSIIKVRAMDKAGNERVAEYMPLKKLFPYRWLVIIFLLATGIILWFIRRKKNEK